MNQLYVKRVKMEIGLLDKSGYYRLYFLLEQTKKQYLNCFKEQRQKRLRMGFWDCHMTPYIMITDTLMDTPLREMIIYCIHTIY